MRQDPTGMLDIGPDDGPGDPKKGGETASGSKNKILQGGLLAEGTVVEKAPNKITSLLVRNAVNAGRFFKRSAEATKDWLSNVTTADVFNTTLDFIPIAGGLKDIWQGISDGNGWIIALGVGTVALDIFTFGSASLLKGSVKLGIRGVRKAAQKKAVRETSETLAEQGVKKAAKSSKWIYGGFKSSTKWANQLAKRGWTEKQIGEAISKGKSFNAINNVNKANGATRFVHPKTGQSVVIDDVTKELLHVGGPGFKY